MLLTITFREIGTNLLTTVLLRWNKKPLTDSLESVVQNLILDVRNSRSSLDRYDPRPCAANILLHVYNGMERPLDPRFRGKLLDQPTRFYHVRDLIIILDCGYIASQRLKPPNL